MIGNTKIAESAVMTLVVILNTGCDKTDATESDMAISGTLPIHTVLGIDRSAGEEMTRQGIEIAKAYVLATAPCDRLQLRWISHQSFLASESLGDLRLRCLPAAATAFDPAASRKYHQALVAIDQSRREALAALDSYTAHLPGPTPRTDIVGFVAAASASLADASEYAPALVVISDFEDNLQRSATADLTGAHVTLHLVGHQVDPQRAQSLIETWAATFEELGAESVRLRSDPPPPYNVESGQ